MEPITTTIITSAIAGALGNLSSDAVKAGYRKLQELVLRKCGAAGQAALENWEKKPDSAAWQGALHEELQTANADKDAEIIKATEELLALLGKASAVSAGINQPVSGSNNKAIAVSGSQNVSITA